MLNWFQGNQINIFRSLLRRLKSLAAQEINDATKLSAGYSIIDEMAKLVGEENTEKALENQLIHQFKKHEAKLRQKSEALTQQLWSRITGIAKILESTWYALAEFEEALKKGNKAGAGMSKKRLNSELLNLEKETSLAEELVNYLSQVEQIPNVVCTVEFAKKLNSNEFRGSLREIEVLLERMSNPAWLSRNSKKLWSQRGNEDFFSCPAGEFNLRIIFKIQGNAITIYDVMRHREYESFFSSGRISATYHGAMAVFKPLAAFARLAA